MRVRVVLLGVFLAELLTRVTDHRGYWHLLHLIARIAPDELMPVISKGVALEISPRDPYWLRIAAPHYTYEPEVLEILGRWSDLPIDFIDAGANIGYWSLLVADRFPKAQVIAIEPNPQVFRVLEKNTEQTNSRISLLKAAVVTSLDDQTTLYVPHSGQFHTDGSVLRPKSGLAHQAFEIPAIRLEDLIADQLASSQLIILKLDVEGMEQSIFEDMASKPIDSRIALIYEDHGNDAQHKATLSLMATRAFDIYFLQSNVPPLAIDTVESLRVFKSRSSKGYNLVAVPKTGPWSRHTHRLQT